MFDKDDWKLALEDARFQHNAIVSLIYSINSQAMGLLRLFSVIALASATGAVGALSQSTGLSITLGWELTDDLGAGVVIMAVLSCSRGKRHAFAGSRGRVLARGSRWRYRA